MRVFLSTAFSIFTVCFTNIAVAIDEAKSSIEKIVINGEQIKDSANYTVLSRAEFINKAQTLSDILNQINGIQIRQISGVGNSAAVSIRGSSSKQVQLYIDGQLVETVNMNSEKIIDLSHYKNGMYFVVVRNEGQVMTKKITKI